MQYTSDVDKSPSQDACTPRTDQLLHTLPIALYYDLSHSKRNANLLVKTQEWQFTRQHPALNNDVGIGN